MHPERRILAHTSAGWKRDWLKDDECSARGEQRLDAMPLCQRFTVEYARNQFIQLGVLRMPDNSAVLSVPDRITDDNTLTARAVNSILEILVPQAEVSCVEHLRILLPCPGDAKANSPLRECFSAFGFVSTMHVAEMTKPLHVQNVAGDHGNRNRQNAEGITFHSLTCDVGESPGPGESDRVELAAAIDAIETGAMNNPSVPRPTGENLLQLWSLFSDEVRIFQGICCDRIAGVAVLRGTASESNRHETLEYLGVLPSLRRQGIARQLLEFAVRSIPDQTVLTTFVDNRNTAAVTFYESSGFALREVHELWMRTTENASGVKRIRN